MWRQLRVDLREVQLRLPQDEVTLVVAVDAVMVRLRPAVVRAVVAAVPVVPAAEHPLRPQAPCCPRIAALRPR